MLFTLERSLQNNSTMIERLMWFTHRTWTPLVCVSRQSREDGSLQEEDLLQIFGVEQKGVSEDYSYVLG